MFWSGFTAWAVGAVAVLSALAARVAIVIARRHGYLDGPGERKVQAHPVPLLGGLALVAALGLAIGGALILRPDLFNDDPGLYLRLAGAVIWLLVIGLIDDRRGLSARLRLVAQLMPLLLFIQEAAAWLPHPAPAMALAAVWLVGLTNSLNFLDNIDALCASTSFWTALALALLFGPESPIFLLMLLLAGSLLGFLFWNRPPARIYLGDAGSTVLGFTLGVIVLLALRKANLSPWLAPVLLAVPIYDTTTVMWIRFREGRPLWQGDRRHVSHRLLGRGLTVGGVVLRLNLWTIASSATALAFHYLVWPGWLLLAAVVGVACLLFMRERKTESSSMQSRG